MKKKKKIGLIDVLLVILIIIGGIVLIYPFISQYYYRYQAQDTIQAFNKERQNLDQEDISRRILLAEAYNDSLLTGLGADLEDPYSEEERIEGIKEYARMLEVNEEIGLVKIPKIAEELPIYAGTSEDVLQKGVGHLEGTSLPIGGTNTHSVITAHSGLPTARLFTDLEKLEIGDRFYITNIKETLAYQVDEIHVIEPTDFSKLLVEEGKDQVTLLTCTPYMINSHRLIVKGSRIEYQKQVEMKDLEIAQEEGLYKKLLLVSLILLLILIFILFRNRKKYKALEKEIKNIRKES